MKKISMKEIEKKLIEAGYKPPFKFHKISQLPGGPIIDRSLEAFNPLLEEINLLTKGIIDPEIKQQVTPIVRDFYTEMREILGTALQQQRGYSDKFNYDLSKTPWGQNI